MSERAWVSYCSTSIIQRQQAYVNKKLVHYSYDTREEYEHSNKPQHNGGRVLTPVGLYHGLENRSQNAHQTSLPQNAAP